VVGDHLQIVDGRPVLVPPPPERAAIPHAIRVVWASDGLPYESPQGSPDWLEDGMQHILEIEWGKPSELATSSAEPAIMIIPAATP
jgi:hypothetical protein